MAIESSIIETGVDKLVHIVRERGKIALADAAKELGVSPTVIQEWVDFLEEEGIISVEYKLTKPFLVDRKLTQKEVEVKAKEFTNKKDVFVRKAEVNLSFLEKQAEELKKVKSAFDNVKNELGLKLDTVRSELSELEKYQQLKEELQKQVIEQKSNTKLKIDDLTKQVLREQKKYKELVSDIKKEKDELAKERAEARSIEESEKILNEKLLDLKAMIRLIEKKILNEDTSIKNSELHIERLSQLIEEIKQSVENEKSSISPLMEQSEELEKKMEELQDKIIKKISQNPKNEYEIKEMTRKIKDFFDKKFVIVNLVDKVNKDRDDLEKSLIELIKKAKSFQLTTKQANMGNDMVDLEKKFNEVDKKKEMFEDELKKLTSLFK